MDEDEPPAQEELAAQGAAPTDAEIRALALARMRDGMALTTDQARLGLLAGPVPHDATVVGVDDDGTFIINPDLLFGP